MDHEERHDLHEIAHWLKEISHTLRRLVPRPEQPATQFEAVQISGGTTMAKLKASFPGPIVGIQAGSSGSLGFSPAGADGQPGLLQAGNVPVVTVDDPNVTFVTAVDGSSAQYNVPSSDTAASFNTTVSGINSLGVAISSTFNVPILAAAPPPEQAATQFLAEQLS
jgi:hypothetical protein